MIQPLRTVHRHVFVALAFVLPAVLVAGLGARHAPLPSHIPSIALPSSAYLVRKSGTLWQEHSIGTEFYRNSSRPGEILVALHPSPELSEPDLLLYWSVTEPNGNSLPATSQLLGSFAVDKASTLPSNADRGGYLILFSLPHQSLIATARVEKLP